VTRASLRDAWVDAGQGPANTMPATNPRLRIDYLLYGEPLRATRTVVLPTLVSDHRGVLARFVLSVAGDEVCVPVLDGPVGSGGG
jgi:endonuclease/exonuclease/phosphatase (EEP) superfamily protein YafD